MKRRNFVRIGVALAVVMVATLAWLGWVRQHGNDIHVQTALVTEGPIVRRLVVAGTLQPVTSVDVGSQVSGTIQSLGADFNSIVKKGQVLAQLDPASFEAALADAQAMLGKAKSDQAGLEVAVEDTRVKLERAQSLASRQLIPQSDLDDAKIAARQALADLESGKAQVVRAEGAVEQAQTDLSHTTIRSPVDGIVINRSVDVGQTVAASFQAPVLFHLAANLDRMQLQAEVDEADIGSVKEGESLTFEVESYPNEMFRGTVSTVRLQPTTPTPVSGSGGGGGGPASSANNGITYTTIVDVMNPDKRLRPGMTATAFISSSNSRDAVRLPNTALLFRPSADLLKAVGEPVPADPRAHRNGDEEDDEVWQWDGKRFAPVAVRIGRSDALWSEELSGALKPGATLVTNASLNKASPAK